MNDSITIYTGALQKVSVSKRNPELTPEVEEELKKLLWAKKTIDDALNEITEKLGVAMEKANVNLLEREYVKVTRSTVGRRFAFDPKKKVDPKFCQTTQYLQPNTKAIDAYLELKKRLPTGILENTRKQKVEVSLIEDQEK